MSKRFGIVAITGKSFDRQVLHTVTRLVEHLVGSGRTVLVESAMFGRRKPPVKAEAVGLPDLVDRAELVISVGGDGTLLRTSRLLAGRETPLMGINLGRLGFLVDVSPDNMSDVDAILAGNFVTDERILLEAWVANGDATGAKSLSLNDVVIHRWNTARMVEMEVRVEGELVTRLRSDGLIIATPTGSTAYSMASGGPIAHPGVDALLLVPVAPHSLSNRPVVLPGDVSIEVRVLGGGSKHVRVSCDSQEELPMQPGSVLTVRRSPNRVKVLHPPGYRYFEILRAKLRWGDGGSA
ncbi:NAD+ kinase [Natronocella acetinitrilica]|uniref:NAD kinase n=1 Tax=Natronocella acetinitrilica TaxID=414046 RepID=A0AAE3KH60_9GAMM|nr:NAD(+) kinase [Natronocella acetinitrilica]MCP1676012.1 NAD+ kinase [Natronocella acetinitrilica]